MRRLLLLATAAIAFSATSQAAVTYTNASITEATTFAFGPFYPPFPLLPVGNAVLPKLNLGALDVLDSVTVYALFHADHFLSVYNNTPSYQLDAVSYYATGMTWRVQPLLTNAPSFYASAGRASNFATFGGIGLDPAHWLYLPVTDHFDIVAGGTLDPSFNAQFVGSSGTVGVRLMMHNYGALGGSGFAAMDWRSNMDVWGDVFVRYDYRIGTDDGLTDVPEPMTLSVLGAGLGGLAMARRKRRQRLAERPEAR